MMVVETVLVPCQRYRCIRLAVSPSSFCCTHCMAPVAGRPHRIECELRHKAFTKDAIP